MIPNLKKKAADIIGLYMNPPQHAAVFCVDEKTAIQALDRLVLFCHCHPAAQNGTVLNITVTGLCRCMRH